MNKSQEAYWSEYVRTRLNIFFKDIKRFQLAKPETPKALKELVSTLENHAMKLKELSERLDADEATRQDVNRELENSRRPKTSG